MSKPFKQFVVRKYVMARTATEAIRLEKKYDVDDVWIDDDWKKQNVEMKQVKGFKKCVTN